MKGPEEKLLNLVNGSGFLFQLGIEAEVSTSYDQHGWKAVVREYPWYQAGGGSGFIDLIVWRNNIRLVIECKRTKDATWAFLSLTDQHVTRFRSAWAARSKDQRLRAGWFDFQVGPTSPVSEFCIVRGQGENDRPLLERICAGLVQSVDGLVEEELRIIERQNTEFLTIYVPVIVTNAELQLCVYNPRDISLSDGTIPRAKFQPVPFIRFDKSLANVLSLDSTADDFRSALADRQRSIFVVSASSLVDFLRQLTVGGAHQAFAPVPWR